MGQGRLTNDIWLVGSRPAVTEIVVTEDGITGVQQHTHDLIVEVHICTQSVRHDYQARPSATSCHLVQAFQCAGPAVG